MNKSICDVIVFDFIPHPVGHFEIGKLDNITFEYEYIIKKISRVIVNNNNSFLTTYFNDNYLARREVKLIEQKLNLIPKDEV